MRPESGLTSNRRELLARSRGASIGLFHRGAAEIRGNRREQLAPADASLVADDVDAREARTLDDVVAVGRGFDAGHFADVAAQPAADADLVVIVFVEELEHPGLQRLYHAAAAAPDIRQAADGL